MVATEKAKVELEFSKRMWLAHYETYLKQQEVEQWRIDRLKDVEEAEFNTPIAEAEKRASLSREK